MEKFTQKFRFVIFSQQLRRSGNPARKPYYGSSLFVSSITCLLFRPQRHPSRPLYTRRKKGKRFPSLAQGHSQGEAELRASPMLSASRSVVSAPPSAFPVQRAGAPSSSWMDCRCGQKMKTLWPSRCGAFQAAAESRAGPHSRGLRLCRGHTLPKLRAGCGRARGADLWPV